MKIVDDCLEVTEQKIAVLFLGERAESDGEVGVICSIHRDGWQLEVESFEHGAVYEAVYDSFQYPIPIHKATVKKVCEAKEGRPSFAYDTLYPGDETPHYSNSKIHPCCDNPTVIKANALTIGKTVSELRELVEWMEK